MSITTVTSREFSQYAGEAKKAANSGPVFITDRGRPSHVLLSFEEYQRLTGGRRSIAEALSLPGAEDVAFEPQKAEIRAVEADLL